MLFIIAYHPIQEVTLFFNYNLYRRNRKTKLHDNQLNDFSSNNLEKLLRISDKI
ncbi:asparaginase domain-containing protein [Buchnera aphidicola]|uniref:asparaginase domain-containing protein n=1 Tax=Buchnera aphidicola TaxID=9 RepID=UPI0034648B2D